MVGRPHGLDGSFHVSQPVASLLAIGGVIRIAERELRIERRAGTDRRPILRLQGSSRREDAAALTGKEMLVSRDVAPPLGPDEWWADDLEGCAVHDAGRAVGTVKRLLALPSCDVLEVTRVGQAGELLVPLVSDAVREVDVERRLIDIDLRFLDVEVAD